MQSMSQSKRNKHVEPEEHEDEERITELEHIVVNEFSGDEPEEGHDDVCDDILHS
jgi:hypothetical protein